MEIITQSSYGINQLIHHNNNYIFKHCFRTIWKVTDSMNIAEIMSKYERDCIRYKNRF